MLYPVHTYYLFYYQHTVTMYATMLGGIILQHNVLTWSPNYHSTNRIDIG